MVAVDRHFFTMLWKGLQLFSPVTKRHVEHQILKNTQMHHLFQIIQDVDQYSRYVKKIEFVKNGCSF